MSAPLSRKNLPENPSPDDILNVFLDYLTATNTEPYDHQEEAILELFAGNNVILNTPTGSGKSLVALVLQLALNFSVSDFRISAFTKSPSATSSARKTSA